MSFSSNSSIIWRKNTFYPIAICDEGDRFGNVISRGHVRIVGGGGQGRGLDPPPWKITKYRVSWQFVKIYKNGKMFTLYLNLSIFTVFLKNKNFISNIRRPKVTAYAALKSYRDHAIFFAMRTTPVCVMRTTSFVSCEQQMHPRSLIVASGMYSILAS